MLDANSSPWFLVSEVFFGVCLVKKSKEDEASDGDLSFRTQTLSYHHENCNLVTNVYDSSTHLLITSFNLKHQTQRLNLSYIDSHFKQIWRLGYFGFALSPLVKLAT